MTKFLERMQDKFKGSKFGLIEFIAICNVVQIFLGFYILYRGYSYRAIFDNIHEFDHRPSISKSCHLAMTSILQKRVSTIVFDKNIVEKIEEENYSFFDFVGNEEIFDIIKNKSQCTVILKDKIGHRFFKFSFKDSIHNNHIYGRFIDAIEEITHENLTLEEK